MANGVVRKPRSRPHQSTKAIRRPIAGGDEWLNYPAAAADFRIPFSTFEGRQRPENGWRGNDWKPLRTTHFTVTVGTTKRSVRFIRKSQLRECLDRDAAIKIAFSSQGVETNERFLWKGEWVLTFWKVRQNIFRHGSPKLVRGALARQGINSERIKHPLTGFMIEVCAENRAIAAADANDARIEASSRNAKPPLLDGRPTMWWRVFVERLGDAQGRARPEREHGPVGWIEKGCVHLDGRKIRAGRLETGRKQRFIDQEDAAAILASIKAEREGEVHANRQMLTAAEGRREFGFLRGKIGELRRKKAIDGVKLNSNLSLNDRKGLALARDREKARAINPYGAPVGFAIGKDLPLMVDFADIPAGKRAFDLPRWLPVFRKERKQGADWRIAVHRCGRPVYAYRTSEVLPWLHAKLKDARNRLQKRERPNLERDKIWYEQWLAGAKYGQIRDLYRNAHPSDLEPGEPGWDVVRQAVRIHKKRLESEKDGGN